MTEGKLATQQDVEDFVRGCALLGTGGGGSPEKGRQFLSGTLERAGQIAWVDPSEIPDEAWTVCPFYMGSIAPQDSNLPARLQEMGMQVRVKKELVQAVRELMAYSGMNPQFVVAAEMGGLNTPAPVDAAYELGLKVVDGDFSGRAIPEITQSLIAVHGRSVFPIVFCDYAGSVTIVKNAPSYKMVERIGKLVSAASFGLVGSAGFMLKGKDLKPILYPGTLSRALQIGQAIRRAREMGEDPVEVTARCLGGWVLFKGTVLEKQWEDREGYLYGHYQMAGRDEFSGKGFKVWFKNENHMTWLDDRPFVMSPDIIASIKLADGEPITNTDISVREPLAIIGSSIHPVYRGEKGLAVLGPKHFGFPYDYVPIEELLSKHR